MAAAQPTQDQISQVVAITQADDSAAKFLLMVSTAKDRNTKHQTEAKPAEE